MSAAQPRTSRYQMRTLVFFHYFEKSETYKNNLLHFLRFGYDEAADFNIVVSGASTVSIPELRNLRRIEVENMNFDYGGYCAAIAATPNLQCYDAFVFVNSSMRGPYVPSYAKGPWYRAFTDCFDDDVGLVGAAINECSSRDAELYRKKYGGSGSCAHVQSTAYAMPARTMRMLLESGFYEDRPALDKGDVISEYELRLSQLVLQSGWDLKCLLPEYNLVDYRTGEACRNVTSRRGDPSWPFGYFGRSAHPYETMFVKTERGIFSLAYLARLSASMNARADIRARDDRISPSMAPFLASLEACQKSADVVVAEVRGNQLREDFTAARRRISRQIKSALGLRSGRGR